MAEPQFSAPVTAAPDAASALRDSGHAVLDPQGFTMLAATTLAELEPLRSSWNDLPPYHPPSTSAAQY